MIDVFMRLICVVLLLTGCVNHLGTAVSLEDKKVCMMACENRFGQCQDACVDSCKTCAKQANQETTTYYRHYRHERCVQGKTMVRRLQSYHDPLQCKKSSCDCPADYRVCVDACSGDVHKRLQVAPMCC